MEIHHRPSPATGVAVLALDGGLDHSNRDMFVETMDRLLAEGTKHAVLDLQRLTYISSWGLAALVKVHHHWAVRGGRLAFANLHGAVARVLHLARLDRLFDLYETVEEAARAVAPPAGPETPASSGTDPAPSENGETPPAKERPPLQQEPSAREGDEAPPKA